MCTLLLYSGIPVFEMCLNETGNQGCSRTDIPILFYAGEELEILFPVVYIGAGNFGAMYLVTSITLSRPNFGTLISCETSQLSNFEFTCSDVHDDVAGRICDNFTTDEKDYFNGSFVINSTSVNDSGNYIVSIIGRDTTSATVTTSSTTSISSSFTRFTIALTLSASAVIRTRKCGEAWFAGFNWDLEFRGGGMLK